MSLISARGRQRQADVCEIFNLQKHNAKFQFYKVKKVLHKLHSVTINKPKPLYK